jgi:hypothetical protein
MGGLDSWLEPILQESMTILLRDHGENLLSVVRFGSTTQFIKYETDVDILLIFRDLPHRRQRHDHLQAWEDATNLRFSSALPQGFDLVLSPQMRSCEEAKSWSKLYLDMAENCSVVYDPKGIFAQILEQTRHWMRIHSARKTWLNGLPVWRYPLEATGAVFDLDLDSPVIPAVT